MIFLRNRKGMLKIVFIILFICLTSVAFGVIQIQKKLEKKDAQIAGMLTAVKSRQDTGDQEQQKLIDSLKASLATAMSQNRELNQTITSLQGQINNLGGEIKNKNAQINSLTVERARAENTFNQQISDYQNKLETAESNIEDLDSKIEQTTQEYENLKAKTEKEITTLTQDLNSLDEEKQKLESRLLKLQKNRLVQETAKMHYNLGNLFVESEKFEQAEKEYLESLKLNPQDEDAHYNLALLYDIYFNDFPKAIKHYQKCLEINPRYRKCKDLEKRILDLQLKDAVSISPTYARDKRKNYFNPDKIMLPPSE